MQYKKKIISGYTETEADYGKVITLTSTNNLDRNLFTIITSKK
jgi:hypothetical protein